MKANSIILLLAGSIARGSLRVSFSLARGLSLWTGAQTPAAMPRVSYNREPTDVGCGCALGVY
jgi:hypothetical protein